jgi:Arc/MetJ-type ribon-helix-helix transcriptional regulator
MKVTDDQVERKCKQIYESIFASPAWEDAVGQGTYRKFVRILLEERVHAESVIRAARRLLREDTLDNQKRIKSASRRLTQFRRRKRRKRVVLDLFKGR